MVINWKVRLRNPSFWVGIISMTISFVYDILSLFEIVPAISADTFVGLMKQAVNIMAFAGVLNDPTTSGWNDSDRAMKYVEPWKDDVIEDEAGSLE